MASYKKKLEQAQVAERCLWQLLAVMHRDGGHHTVEVGVEQSTQEAIQRFYQMSQALAEGRDATEM